MLSSLVISINCAFCLVILSEKIILNAFILSSVLLAVAGTNYKNIVLIYFQSGTGRVTGNSRRVLRLFGFVLKFMRGESEIDNCNINDL